MASSAALTFQRRSLIARQTVARLPMNPTTNKPACDVFINHRGVDTKRTIASLLHDYLSLLNVPAFLDKNIKPGDNFLQNIHSAIRDCKVAVTVFSPRYFESYYCLYELALLMESRKKIIPIFCDIKPSQLCREDSYYNGRYSTKDVRRFRWALQEARFTLGLTFDSSQGNWSDVLTRVSNIVMKSLMEMENEEQKKI